MTREEITAMFKRRDAAWDAHDAAALASDHAAECVVISPTGGVLEGRDEIQRIYQIWFTAFPDPVGICLVMPTETSPGKGCVPVLPK